MEQVVGLSSHRRSSDEGEPDRGPVDGAGPLVLGQGLEDERDARDHGDALGLDRGEDGSALESVDELEAHIDALADLGFQALRQGFQPFAFANPVGNR